MNFKCVACHVLPCIPKAKLSRVLGGCAIQICLTISTVYLSFLSFYWYFRLLFNKVILKKVCNLQKSGNFKELMYKNGKTDWFAELMVTKTFPFNQAYH